MSARLQPSAQRELRHEPLEHRLLLAVHPFSNDHNSYQICPTGCTHGVEAFDSASISDFAVQPGPHLRGQDAAQLGIGQGQFTLGGAKWPESLFPIPYYVNTSGLPAGMSESAYVAAIDGAFQAIGDIATTAIRFEKIGHGTQFGTGASDGTTTVGFGEAVPGSLAHATWYTNGAGIYEFDVVLGTDRGSWSTSPGGGQVDVWATAAHEIGHGIGLGHSEDTQATMYYAIFIGSTHQRHFNSDDIAGLEQLYPQSSTPPPMAEDDVYTTDEDVMLVVNAANGVMNNDFIPTGESLTIHVVESPAHGTLVLNSNGSFQYTPNVNYFGSDSFRYQLRGSANGESEATTTINILSLPDPPTATDDVVEVAEDSTLRTGLPNETAIPLGANWKYLDTGVDQGTAWLDPTYNDSAWRAGAAELGYGDGDETTVVRFSNDENSKFATTYFRSSFEITDAAGFNRLTLNLLRDDSAAVYLNGTEIFRDSVLPFDASFDLYTGHSIREMGFQEFDVDGSGLIEGTNVLAVEVHQATPGTSDLSFDLALHDSADDSLLFSAGSDWKYNDQGSNLGTTWREPHFDDSTWPSGPAQLGYGEGDEATVVKFANDENSKFITTYFRHAFELSDVDRIAQIDINLQRDDGAAVYLNGSELVRDNLVADALFQTPAVLFNSVDEEALLPFTLLNISNIEVVEGTNVLAAEIHQIQGTSSDISFDLEFNVKRDVPFGVLANDSDADGDPLTAMVLTLPQHGTLSLNTDGHFSYTPNPDFSGVDEFTYRIFDQFTSEQRILEFGSVWKYLDDGSDQGTAWQQSSYDDSAWASGPAELGYGDGDEATEVSFGPNPANKFPTTYFRTSFPITAAGSGQFTANMVRDDAAAVYLNGIEVFRDTHLPTNAEFNQFATSGIATEDEPVTFSIDASLFSVGSNVLAVEVHQVGGTSSDISFDLELQGTIPGSDDGSVTIVVTPVNDLPIGIDDHYELTDLGSLIVNDLNGVLSNDIDLENDRLSAVVVTPPNHGILSLTPEGSFIYTPNADFHGSDTFVYQTLDAPLVHSPFISQGSSWQYLDNGSNPEVGWRDPTSSFTDEHWSTGPSQLGYGDGDEQTVISYGSNANAKHATTYFRQIFDIPVASRVETLDAWLLRDDAAIVYLNGAEVYRDVELPSNAAYDLYTNNYNAEDNRTTTFSISPDLLVDGENLVAVEVHQSDQGSTDLSFDFELTAELAIANPATVTIDVGSTIPGDLNQNGTVDAEDIDALFAAIATGQTDLKFDLDENNSVESADADFLIGSILKTTRGDTDLDGDVDTIDITNMIIHFSSANVTGRRWSQGDTNGDGDVDTADLTTAIIGFTGARAN